MEDDLKARCVRVGGRAGELVGYDVFMVLNVEYVFRVPNVEAELT